VLLIDARNIYGKVTCKIYFRIFLYWGGAVE
jgi:hypothetical protein